jgi:hypothetical protein
MSFDPNVATYRTYAQECFRVAQATPESRARKRWIEMAQNWLRWAEQEEDVAAKDAPTGDGAATIW